VTALAVALAASGLSCSAVPLSASVDGDERPGGRGHGCSRNASGLDSNPELVQ
jgi:hypothetical protein